MMRTTRLVILLVLLFSASTFAVDWSSLDRYMEDHRRKFGLPGAALAVVGRDGVVHTWTGGNWPDSDSPYYLGSLSKIITGAAIVESAHDGELTLEDRVQDWLPELEISGPNTGRLTLSHLLNHESGFGRRSGFISIPTLKQLGSTSVELNLRYAPGTDTSYSNLNHILLGLILERATGRPFAEYVQDRVFGPLQMSNSSAKKREPGNMVPGYQYLYGLAVKSRQMSYDETAIPAGFIVSSPRDMGRFLAAHLGEYGRQDAGMLPAAMVSNRSHEAAAAGTRIRGWSVSTIGETAVLHVSGATATSYSFMALLPDADSGFIFMANVNAYTPIVTSIEGVSEGVLFYLTAGEGEEQFPYNRLVLAAFGVLMLVGIASLVRAVAGWIKAGTPFVISRSWSAWSALLLGNLIVPLAVMWLLLRFFGIGPTQLLSLQPDVGWAAIVGIASGFFSGLFKRITPAAGEAGR